MLTSQYYLTATVTHIQSDMRIYTTFFTLHRTWSDRRNKNFGTDVNTASEGNLSAWLFWNAYYSSSAPVQGQIQNMFCIKKGLLLTPMYRNFPNTEANSLVCVKKLDRNFVFSQSAFILMRLEANTWFCYMVMLFIPFFGRVCWYWALLSSERKRLDVDNMATVGVYYV
jgi:hypothetical protein